MNLQRNKSLAGLDPDVTFTKILRSTFLFKSSYIQRFNFCDLGLLEKNVDDEIGSKMVLHMGSYLYSSC